ncbi:hypothetical protein BCR35DRAFT_81856 [Leucosporidium creatinivorum]|uniref:Uncharacterized protein n=1 Tax=Leucosporidium creatinivorum TaxID=106004 RepID=A0A1Y2FGC8_9BASI|nr:hypothetical protein BCR35DRAFT_81856 [Leucosporidium creatinivorum]
MDLGGGAAGGDVPYSSGGDYSSAGGASQYPDTTADASAYPDDYRDSPGDYTDRGAPEDYSTPYQEQQPYERPYEEPYQEPYQESYQEPYQPPVAAAAYYDEREEQNRAHEECARAEDAYTKALAAHEHKPSQRSVRKVFETLRRLRELQHELGLDVEPVPTAAELCLPQAEYEKYLLHYGLPNEHAHLQGLSDEEEGALEHHAHHAEHHQLTVAQAQEALTRAKHHLQECEAHLAKLQNRPRHSRRAKNAAKHELHEAEEAVLEAKDAVADAEQDLRDAEAREHGQDPHAAFVPVAASGEHPEEPHEKDSPPDDSREKGAFDPAGQSAHDAAHAEAEKDHKAAESKVQDAEKKLKEAKQGGDPAAIAAAEEHLKSAKKERHAASQKERELRQHASPHPLEATRDSDHAEHRDAKQHLAALSAVDVSKLAPAEKVAHAKAVHEAKARVAASHSKQVEHAQLQLDRAKQDLADDPTNAAAQAHVKAAEVKLRSEEVKHLEAKRDEAEARVRLHPVGSEEHTQALQDLHGAHAAVEAHNHEHPTRGHHHRQKIAALEAMDTTKMNPSELQAHKEKIAAAREAHRGHRQQKLDQSQNELHEAETHLETTKEGTEERREAQGRVDRAHRRHAHLQAEHSFAELHGADQSQMSEQERAEHHKKLRAAAQHLHDSHHQRETQAAGHVHDAEEEEARIRTAHGEGSAEHLAAQQRLQEARDKHKKHHDRLHHHRSTHASLIGHDHTNPRSLSDSEGEPAHPHRPHPRPNSRHAPASRASVPDHQRREHKLHFRRKHAASHSPTHPEHPHPESHQHHDDQSPARGNAVPNDGAHHGGGALSDNEVQHGNEEAKLERHHSHGHHPSTSPVARSRHHDRHERHQEQLRQRHEEAERAKEEHVRLQKIHAEQKSAESKVALAEALKRRKAAEARRDEESHRGHHWKKKDHFHSMLFFSFVSRALSARC